MVEQNMRHGVYTRRQILTAGATLLGLAGCAPTAVTPVQETSASEVMTTPESTAEPSFMIGSIQFGTEGVGQGPLTLLTIKQPAEIRSENEFVIPTYPRLLTPEDEEPGGNWRENDNPIYLNAGGVIIQTVHSGFLWNGSQLAADPLRAEIQEQGDWLGKTNITSAEGAARRARFTDAPITLQQNKNNEIGTLLGIYHISPSNTNELAEAYVQAAGALVDVTTFSDYSGPPLDPTTDVIYFFCVEAYSDEELRENVPSIEQGREIVIVRIAK